MGEGGTTDETASRQRPGMLQQVATVVGLVLLVASAAYGGDLFGVRERLTGSSVPAAVPAARSRSVAAQPTTASDPRSVLRSQPWWQDVGVAEGTGDAAPRLTVAAGALQWRAEASCEAGHLRVTAAGRAKPLVDLACPGTTVAYATSTGAVSLRVKASSPWRLRLEQQVDVPLEEPPLPEMTAEGTTAVRTGTLYRMDQTGRGRVTFYRLADGRFVLRVDSVFVTPNVDLELRLSPLVAPRTTEEYQREPSVHVAPFDITAGSMNFAVPDGVDPAAFRSLVVWCPLIHSAYAAATLEPPA